MLIRFNTPRAHIRSDSPYKNIPRTSSSGWKAHTRGAFSLLKGHLVFPLCSLCRTLLVAVTALTTTVKDSSSFQQGSCFGLPATIQRGFFLNQVSLSAYVLMHALSSDCVCWFLCNFAVATLPNAAEVWWQGVTGGPFWFRKRISHNKPSGFSVKQRFPFGRHSVMLQTLWWEKSSLQNMCCVVGLCFFVRCTMGLRKSKSGLPNVLSDSNEDTCIPL